LSVQTIASVRRCAFATYIVGNTEQRYDTPEGRAYIAAWCQKARELGESSNVCRVFITKSLKDVSDDTYGRMKDQHSHGVSVLVAEHDKVNGASQGCEMDFGLYDDDCVMTVTPRPGLSDRLSVVVGNNGTNGALIHRYREFKKRIVATALDFDSFSKLFLAPVNAQFWNHRHLHHAPLWVHRTDYRRRMPPQLLTLSFGICRIGNRFVLPFSA
jgi:hypothetical protein